MAGIRKGVIPLLNHNSLFHGLLLHLCGAVGPQGQQPPAIQGRKGAPLQEREEDGRPDQHCGPPQSPVPAAGVHARPVRS